MVLDTLVPAAHALIYNYGVDPPISVEDQFFLTLIKLRTHPTNKELGIFFGLNEKQVSNLDKFHVLSVGGNRMVAFTRVYC